jgi:N-acetylmuramoyl-L-alanine amidase
MKICMSSGHGKIVRGAAGPSPWGLDEVNEARRVVALVATILNGSGVPTKTFNDDVSTTQNENLNRIVDFHNKQVRDLDVSIHFNAYEPTTSKPMGTEVLYLTQGDLAADAASAIADAGHFLDRGPKKRTDLFFLNKTDMPSILIETCFVDSKPDADLYRKHFDAVCAAIADAVSGEETEFPPPIPPEADAEFHAVGKCSHFGGPNDEGVSSDEDLAFIFEIEQAPHLFLPYQPEGTTGLARRLNPFVHYLACRWDYDITPQEMLRTKVALIRNRRTGFALKAFPADWGPHEEKTGGRVADLSPQLMDDLDLETDDEVEIIFPYIEVAA